MYTIDSLYRLKMLCLTCQRYLFCFFLFLVYNLEEARCMLRLFPSTCLDSSEIISFGMGGGEGQTQLAPSTTMVSPEMKLPAEDAR